ncbi:hypothetical protein UFOVP53_67 [uncultured Caudovirales phage]|uniref:Uncharacterized protein n=1 Tax=uncultured Caudovirales phage TaxID=2100421 RepID=A0A6J5KY29_9CAUD|nr:hypothetical protein UFOVP53_67 [uncultured Caudovirales phage]
MATITGQITVDEVLIIEVSGDPSITGGTPAPVGSIALDKTGKTWTKYGTLDTEWREVGTPSAIYTEDVKISTMLGAPTDLADLREWLNHIWSVGITAGAVCTDNGNGTVNISEGTALLRQMNVVTLSRIGSVVTVYSPAHDFQSGEFINIEGAIQTEYNGNFSILFVDADHYTYQIIGTPATPATGTIYSTGEHSLLIPSIVPAITNLTMVDHTTNYIYASKDGSPNYTTTTTSTVLGISNKALVYTIAREGTKLYVLDGRLMNVDPIRKLRARQLETDSLKPVLGGSIIGESGTRNLTVTAGAFYYGLQKVSHKSFNTSTTDTFTYCYRNGSGGWTYVPNSTQITNIAYDDGTGTLHTANNNNYVVSYVYMMNDSPSSLLVQYGQQNYSNLANAQASLVPASPAIVAGVGALLGRIIVSKNSTTFDDISSAFSSTFNPAIASNHENLAGLLGGAALDHQHLTTAQLAVVVATSGINTGDQTNITGNSGTTTAALGIKTATTTVAVSTATAPITGQVLTATSTTAATWQTPMSQIDGGSAASVYGGTVAIDGGGA